ncbi:MAG TPA: hypothetical protein VMP01_13530 [Pirellulaceae bacterium]|nr:hypothetical protein [Pirellulaceae bacterium]
MQLFGSKRAIDTLALMPTTTPRFKSLLMRRPDLLDEQLSQLIQVCPVATEHNAVWFTEETINHLYEVSRLNAGVRMPVG